MIINILGTEYNLVKKTADEYQKLKLADASGLFEAYSKEIIISKDIYSNTGTEYEKLNLFENKVIRHEIIHAFFYESGLQNYCDDEKLVDFIAIQFKKMYVAINSVNAIE